MKKRCFIAILLLSFLAGCAAQGGAESLPAKSLVLVSEEQVSQSGSDPSVSAPEESGAAEAGENSQPQPCTPPEEEDLLQRAKNAATCKEICLEGLTFEERCALVIAWELENRIYTLDRFGLIDLTQNGIPDIFIQKEPWRYGDLIIYDIS